MEVRRKLRRGEVVPFFEGREACMVVLEACGAAHHWARVLTGLGHEVKLIAPEAVRPFVKRGKKNDAADAAALCEAARRPGVRFVPVKSADQQATLALHAARSLLVKQRTMLANAIRGLAAEFGLTAPQGMDKLAQLVAPMEAEATVPAGARRAIRGLLEQCRALGESIEALEAEIVAHARHDETARRLATIPGVGPVTASLIAATVTDIGAFGRARAFAAWLGLAALDRRQDPPGSDHQGRQPGDTQVAGPGRHLNGLPGRRVEQRGRGLGQGRPGAPARQAGDRGAGQQDGAHRLGGDDAQ